MFMKSTQEEKLLVCSKSPAQLGRFVDRNTLWLEEE